MPPHCDTLDGPVIKTAKMALESKNVNLILPWVPEELEDELTDCFNKTIAARMSGEEAREVADRWFFENAVRLHRAGEGAAYSGLKPAGLDWGPVVRKAEQAIESGNAGDVITFVSLTVEQEIGKRFDNMTQKKDHDINNVAAAREYVNSMLEFILFSHHLYKFAITGEGHNKDASKAAKAA